MVKILVSYVLAGGVLGIIVFGIRYPVFGTAVVVFLLLSLIAYLLHDGILVWLGWDNS